MRWWDDRLRILCFVSQCIILIIAGYKNIMNVNFLFLWRWFNRTKCIMSLLLLLFFSDMNVNSQTGRESIDAADLWIVWLAMSKSSLLSQRQYTPHAKSTQIIPLIHNWPREAGFCPTTISGEPKINKIHLARKKKWQFDLITTFFFQFQIRIWSFIMRHVHHFIVNKEY